jgi:hypothetical protein
VEEVEEEERKRSSSGLRGVCFSLFFHISYWLVRLPLWLLWSLITSLLLRPRPYLASADEAVLLLDPFPCVRSSFSSLSLTPSVYISSIMGNCASSPPSISCLR